VIYLLASQPCALSALRTIDRVARRVAFDVAGHDIVLHGSCADCRQPGAR